MNSLVREALRKAAQIQAANGGGAQGSSSRAFSSAAGPAPIPPDARIGDRFIIRLPDYIQVADERSRTRPAILWGVYQDEEENIVAADFLELSSRKNGKENYAGNLHLSPAGAGQGKSLSYVKTSTIYTLLNRSPAQGGNILRREISGSIMFQPYLPDLIVRRVFSLCANGYPNFFPESGLGLSGTVRAGVFFPTLKRCNLRGDRPQPDVPDESHNFTHRAIALPGGLTQDDVNRIVAWADWWTMSGQQRGQGWPEPGTFRDPGWTGWKNLERNWRGIFRDWNRDIERVRFPRGRPDPHHGNCNSVAQPPGPAPSRL